MTLYLQSLYYFGFVICTVEPVSIKVYSNFGNSFLHSGLKITAGKRTMSGLIVGLTGQTLALPVIFGCEHFIIFSIWLSLNVFCSITL